MNTHTHNTIKMSHAASLTKGGLTERVFTAPVCVDCAVVSGGITAGKSGNTQTRTQSYMHPIYPMVHLHNHTHAGYKNGKCRDGHMDSRTHII